ncbi:MAG: lipocalin family protein [Moraxellaceae bacterium]|nr:lipocalin family protein [Pseudobdellovibrionaceae bacterium]
MKQIILIFGFLITIQNQASVDIPQPPVKTVDSVDLQKYLGKWYEIAAIPQSFQKQCVGNTTAVYATAEDDLISVVNTCDTATGAPSVANGRAKVIDKNSNSKLKVTFVHFLGWQFLLGGDYWILAIGENYSYAIVGAPNRDYAWILSRTPGMTNEKIIEANQALVTQGFDTCKLISTIQTSGLQRKIPLCQIVSGK